MKNVKRTAAFALAVCLIAEGGGFQMSTVQASEGSAPSVSDLKVEMLDEPYGINTDDPAFSWVMTDSDPDEVQTAYRIVVASNADDAATGKGTVIDSGWVESSESSYAKVEGIERELTDNSLYYWSVMIKDKDGNKSAWAVPQAFTTEVGEKWESMDGIWYDTENAQNPFEKHGWTNYAVEMDVKTSTVVGIAFRGQDSDNNYFWQIRTSDNKIAPHYVSGGTIASYSNDTVISALRLPQDEWFRVKITAIGNTVKTYIKLSESNEFVEVASHNVDKGFSFGSIGFRTGNSEEGYVDNIDVYAVDENGDKQGDSLYVNDFSEEVSPFNSCSVSDEVLYVPKGISKPTLLSSESIWADEVEAKGNFVFARDSFQIDNIENIDKAIVSVTAKSPENTRQFVYNLYMNGQFAGLGPSRYGESVLYYNTFDVTEYLKNGENVIGAINYTNNEKSFLCQMTVFYKDGTKEVITNSGVEKYGWKVKDGTGAFGDDGTSIGTGYYTAAAQNINANLYPFGWDEPGYNDSEWETPKNQGEIVNNYSLSPYDADNVYRYDVEPAEVIEIGEGHYFIDLGKEIVGGFGLALDSPSSQRIEIRYGEELSGENTVKWQMRTGNNYREYWTLKEGSQEIENTSMMTYRYVEILNCPVKLTTENVKGAAIRQEFSDDESNFASSDELLNRIYNFVKYSIKATNQDLMVDSQSRERGAYEGDVLINSLSSYSFEDDYTLARFSNEWLAESRTWPIEYVYYTVINAWNDYLYTGNKDSIEEYYDVFAKAGDGSLYIDQMDSKTGLLAVKHTNVNQWDSVLVDWPTSEHDGYAFSKSWYNTVMNAVACGAFEAMSNMAEVLGKTADHDMYQGYADTIKQGMINYLYDEEEGAYRDGLTIDGEPVDHYAQHATAFALAYGVYDNEEMAKKLAASIEEDGAIKTSVYGSYFVLSGLYNAGDGDTAMDFMTSDDTRSWQHVMDDLGATIATEAWDPANKSNMTYSHPWGSAPASQIVRGMFGIQPLSAGYSTFQVKLQPGDVDNASVKVPTVKGSIEVSYQKNKQDNTIHATVTVPANTTASVMLPDYGTGYASQIYVDGQLVDAARSGDFLGVELGSGTYTLSTLKEGRISSTLVNDTGYEDIFTGMEYALSTTFTTADGDVSDAAEAGTVTYEPADASMAVVEDGILTILREGTVKINVTAEIDSVVYTTSFDVTARDEYITDAEIVSEDTLYEGEKSTVALEVETETGAKKMLTDAALTVSDDSVLNLKEFTVTALEDSSGKSADVTAEYVIGDSMTLSDSFPSEKLGENIIFEDDFESGADNFYGTSVNNGRLYVGKGVKTYYKGEGSEDWTDYVITGKFTVDSGAANITFRASSDSEYYLWQFRPDDGILKTHVFDEQYASSVGYLLLNTVDISDHITSGENEFRIEVKGDTFTTYLNGTYINTEKNSVLTKGSVGVRNGGSESFWLDDLKVSEPKISLTKTIEVQYDTDAIRTDLQAAVDRAPLDYQYYTEESAQLVQEAAEVAQNLLSLETWSQEQAAEAQEACDALNSAVDGLELKAASEDDLKAVIEQFESIDTSRYEESSSADFAKALEAAKKLIGNDPSEQEVKDAVSALIEASGKLVKKQANISALQEQIKRADEISRDDYWASDLLAMDKLVAEAENLIQKNPDIDSQEEVEAQAAALQRYLDEMKEKADVTALEAAIAAAKEADTENCTAESLQSFWSAYVRAENLLESEPKAGQEEEITSAVKALEESIDALEKEETGESSSGSGDESESPNEGGNGSGSENTSGGSSAGEDIGGGGTGYGSESEHNAASGAVQTGDNSNIFLPAAGIVLAALFLSGIVIIRIRKKRNEG